MTAQQLAQQIVEVVRGYVGRTVDALAPRFEAIEGQLRTLPAGPAGPPGPAGPAGPAGEPGPAGVAGDAGRDGVDGRDGKDFDEQSAGVFFARELAGVHERFAAIEARFESLPVAPPGPAGAPGPAGEPGRDGVNGKDGRDGVDGRSFTLDDVRPWLEAEMAKWALDFERRAVDVLHRSLDRIEKPRDGKDGKDGRDALAVEHMHAQLREDGRTVDFVFDDGNARKEFALVFPVPQYRGVWKEGSYAHGDSVTWGGSTWIAKRDTASKPEADDSWQLAVKRGRDGRDK